MRILGGCAVLSYGSPNHARVYWMKFVISNKKAVFAFGKCMMFLRCALCLIWRLCTMSDSMWVIWSRHNLMKNGTYWLAPDLTLGSWVWRKLLELRDQASSFLRAEVEDGKPLSFWNDNWLLLGRIIDITSTNGPRVVGILIYAHVSDVISFFD